MINDSSHLITGQQIKVIKHNTQASTQKYTVINRGHYYYKNLIMTIELKSLIIILLLAIASG